MYCGLYRDKLLQRGIFEPPLQSLSSEKLDRFCLCKQKSSTVWPRMYH